MDYLVRIAEWPTCGWWVMLTAFDGTYGYLCEDMKVRSTCSRSVSNGGYFDTEDQAIAAYNRFAREIDRSTGLTFAANMFSPKSKPKKKRKLPINIKKKYKWAAMDEDGCWYAHSRKPVVGRIIWRGSCIGLVISINAIKNLPKDIPWQESLHKRTDDGGWVRYEEY